METLPSRTRCLKTLRKVRWDDEVLCIECSGNAVKNGVRSDMIQQYRCRKCGRSFNDRSGTLFSKTQMRLNECIYAIENFEDQESINKISSDLERSWETVNRFLKLYSSSLGVEKLRESLEPRESDEDRLLEEGEEVVDYSKMGCG